MNADQALDGFRLVGIGSGFKSEVCDMIAESQLFADLDWKDIQALAEYVQCYEVSSGTVVFKEGESGTYMFLLVKGEVEILKTGQDGVSHRIVLVTHGKIVGEMSIIDGEKRSASCVATQTSILLLLTKDHYTRIIKEKPVLAVHILARLAKLMSQRLRSVSGQLVEYL
ncbi:Crp/Fnr family transcriptional regulator [Undibacterium sp. Di27W]|uniref:Crp/Fnr family transcriptional regulator n=1 Tax=Undibacterium sp. Di27W TaxID=3413036 RepID=UPI003BF09F78